MDWFLRHWSHVRDVALFVLGALGVVHETVIYPGVRPELLVLFAGMMGLAVAGKGGNGKPQ